MISKQSGIDKIESQRQNSINNESLGPSGDMLTEQYFMGCGNLESVFIAWVVIGNRCVQSDIGGAGA